MQNNDYLINYYNEYDEEGRLANSRVGIVEYLTTRKYIDELLRPDSRIAEIGAGTGRYSVTLAKAGKGSCRSLKDITAKYVPASKAAGSI